MSDEETPAVQRWRPGDVQPEGPYTIASEDMADWRRQFVGSLQSEPGNALIPVDELNDMIALIVNGQTFEQSPFASHPDHYRQMWDSTQREAEAIWGRGHEVVQVNDPG
jgi:hypothetical protein